MIEDARIASPILIVIHLQRISTRALGREDGGARPHILRARFGAGTMCIGEREGGCDGWSRRVLGCYHFLFDHSAHGNNEWLAFNSAHSIALLCDQLVHGLGGGAATLRALRCILDDNARLIRVRTRERRVADS